MKFWLRIVGIILVGFVFWGNLFGRIAHGDEGGEGGSTTYYIDYGDTYTTVLDNIFGGGSCFPAGTKVEAASGAKNIEDIQVGESVVSQREDGSRVMSTVRDVEKPVRNNMCELTYNNGKNLQLTMEHPVYTRGGWKAVSSLGTYRENPNLAVSDLGIGDEVYQWDRSWSKVENISCWSEQNQTYNLILDGDVHTYFAGETLVHNKEAVNSGGGTIHWWTCFPAGTKVTLSDESKVNIEEVKVGDKVLSQSEQGTRSISTVTALDQPMREHMCRLDFTDGGVLKLTNEHPLMTQSGWKSITPSKTAEENPNLVVTSLQIGDHVTREVGEPGILSDISCWSERTQAYNLILDGGAHTYFADGYLAHNKGGDDNGPPGCQDPNCPFGTTPDFAHYSQGFPIDRYAHCSPANDGRTAYWKDDGPNDGWTVFECKSVCPFGPPISTSVAPEATTTIRTTGAFYAYAYGVQRAGAVMFKTWSDLNGEDDVVWYPGISQGGNVYRATINLATHTAAGKGLVHVEVYGWGTNVPIYIGGIFKGSYGCDPKTPLGNANFTVLDNQVQGTVYYDVGNTCSSAVVWNKGSVMVSLDGGTAVAVGTNGKYSVTGTPGSVVSVGLNNIPLQYACSTTCGLSGSCPTITNVTVPDDTGNNFYLTDSRDPWWQTSGAGVYAGTGVTSKLPSASDRLILAGTGTAAALLTGTNSIALGSGSVSDPGWVARSKYKGKTMGYDYFSAHMGVVKGMSEKWSSGGAIEQANCSAGDDFCYGPTGTTGTWNVTSGQKYTVFVNGDLRIGSNIVVEPGGFLAFIVNGSVEVATGVSSMQGLYVMDNDFRTETMYIPNSMNDTQLDVQGTVVAWRTFDLNRSLGVANSGSPAEKFTYRPDLLTNMPDKMKVFAMQWQEVEAGTIGE